MAQLLDYIMSIFDGIIDWIAVIFGYIGSSLGMMINGLRVASAMFGVMVNLPSYFAWLPGAALAIVAQCFTILFIVKVIHLIK